MNKEFGNNPSKRTKYPIIALILTVVCLLMYNMIPGVSYAGKEGVFIDNSVYFTLEEVTLSKGTESQSMQFRVMLNNDGGSTIDFNRYGVKVLTTDGRSYYAQLSEKADALVAAKSAGSFSFIAKLAPDLTVDQLQVNFFDRSRGDADLGSLSVQKAISFQQNDRQFVFNLSDADATATGNTFVSVQAVKAFAYPTDGQWKITVDTQVKVSGTNSWNPTNLNYALNDGQGRTYALKATSVEATSLDGATITHLLLTTTLDVKPDLEKLTLELNKNDASGSNLGQIELQGMFQLAAMGTKGSFDSQSKDGVTVEVTKAEEMNQSGKRQALITAILRNDGKRTIANPGLTGLLVSKDQEISLATETITGTEKYTASGKTAAYQFVVKLPDELVSGSYEFFISEQKTPQSASAGTSSNVTSGAQSGTSSSAGSTGASTNSTTNSSSSTSTGTASTNASSTNSAQSNNVPVIAVDLKDGLTAGTGITADANYELGKPFTFTADNVTIDPKLQVSLVEINAHTNPENGYQTVIAKFKFLNQSQETLALPTFATELQDATGTTYPGARQTTSLQQLIPQSAYVYSYSYLMPPTAKGTFKLSILEETAASKLKLPITAYQVAIHSADEDSPVYLGKTASFYPYTVDIQDWDLSTTYSGGNYTYKMKLNLNITKDQTVIVDDSFASMEFELVDVNGRVLGNTVQTLQGANKLVSGLQTVNFTNIKSEQFNYPLAINVYETMQTSNGTAKRLVAKLQQ